MPYARRGIVYSQLTSFLLNADLVTLDLHRNADAYMLVVVLSGALWDACCIAAYRTDLGCGLQACSMDS